MAKRLERATKGTTRATFFKSETQEHRQKRNREGATILVVTKLRTQLFRVRSVLSPQMKTMHKPCTNLVPKKWSDKSRF